jgi:hypothetical protein
LAIQVVRFPSAPFINPPLTFVSSPSVRFFYG